MVDQTHQPADPASRLPHVGTYRRVLPVSLERMYENALDWAHLPYLHDGSFSAIECIDAGVWGWRARVTSKQGAASEIELRLDRGCRRWITRTLAGANAGAEIWTHAFPVEPRRTDIVVDFFVPDVPVEARAKVGRAYGALYERLYDEDVAMMVGRQSQLDARVFGERGPTSMKLGRRSALRTPSTVAFRGREIVVTRLDAKSDELVAYPARCPHQLGPLSLRPEAGLVTCPWHGYRFDVATGECVSGAACRLNLTARIEVDEDDEVQLIARE